MALGTAIIGLCFIVAVAADATLERVEARSALGSVRRPRRGWQPKRAPGGGPQNRTRRSVRPPAISLRPLRSCASKGAWGGNGAISLGSGHGDAHVLVHRHRGFDGAAAAAGRRRLRRGPRRSITASSGPASRPMAARRSAPKGTDSSPSSRLAEHLRGGRHRDADAPSQASAWPSGEPIRVRMGIHSGRPPRHHDGPGRLRDSPCRPGRGRRPRRPDHRLGCMRPRSSGTRFPPARPCEISVFTA